ncbi:MAG: tetratricopeptide repeat protein [Longimicrobiales bacterium]
MLSVLVLGTPGCSSKQDIRQLREVLVDGLQRHDAALADLARELEALQDTVEIQSDMVVDTRGGLARELRQIQGQVSRLTELTGQIQRTLAALRDQMDDLERSAVGTVRPPGSDSTLVGDPIAAGDDGDQAWNTAQSQFNRGQLGTAKFAFEHFVQIYPEHENAPLALYLLGDILEQEGRLEEALQGFLRVGELFPASDRVSQALYRVGALYVLLGDQDQARQYLRRVIATYPDTGAAALAQEKLREIGG